MAKIVADGCCFVIAVVDVDVDVCVLVNNDGVKAERKLKCGEGSIIARSVVKRRVLRRTGR